MKKNKISIELSNAEINRLTNLLFKGTAYDETYYDRRTCTLDEKFRENFCQMIVDGSDKYKGQNIKVTTFNGTLKDADKDYYLFN